MIRHLPLTRLCAIALTLGSALWACRPRDPPADGARAPATAVGRDTVSWSPSLPRDSMLAAGEAVYLLGHFDSARTLWLSALADARARRDSALEGRLLTWLGLAAYRTGDYAKASRLGEQALQVKLRAGLTADLAQSYNALGLLAWNQGRLAEAAGLFRQAAERAQSVTDARGLAKAANNLALVLTETGDFSGAREGFEEARVAGRRLKDGRIEGGALTNLAMLDIQLGAPGSAIQLLRRARDLDRKSVV